MSTLSKLKNFKICLTAAESNVRPLECDPKSLLRGQVGPNYFKTDECSFLNTRIFLNVTLVSLCLPVMYSTQSRAGENDDVCGDTLSHNFQLDH